MALPDLPNPPASPPTPGSLIEGRAGLIVGAALIGLGLLFLLQRVVDVDLAAAGWPLFVIVPGVALLVWGSSTSGSEGLALAIAGGITTVVGLILAVQNATGLWATWAYAWALVGPGGTGVGMIGHGLARQVADEVRNGLRSLGSGLVLFVAFGLFFEGIVGLSGRPLLTTDAGPIVLIVVGVVVVAAALVTGRRRTA